MTSDTDSFKDAIVLVTGSVGSVGSALTMRLAGLGVQEIRGLDNDESGLFEAAEAAGPGYVPVLGDVRDRDKLVSAMRGVDIVFHAAALKHVPLCETHPLEAVQTNILGVQNVVSAVHLNGVPQLIYTSSDKAVNPPNVMGTSKLMGEQLVKAGNVSRVTSTQVLSSTRFGNVLGSRGSVLPIFARQIRAGGPVTLTHAQMSRFIMTLDEAVDLVLGASTLANGGEVFITKMHSIRIADLAAVMVRLLAPRYGQDPTSIEIREIGIRPGEKLYEELMNEEETRRSIELDDYFVVLPALTDLYDRDDAGYPDRRPGTVERPYNSRNEIAVGQDDLATYLERAGVLAMLEDIE